MSPKSIAVAAVAIVLVGGGVLLWTMRRPAPVPTGPIGVAAPPVVRNETPRAAAPAPEPTTAPTPSTTPRGRRPPAPKEAAAAVEPAPPSASMAVLHIDSDIAGAQVFIDHNYIGVTPVTSPEMSTGSHRLNIVAQGYESIAENIDVEPGPRDLRFNFKEVRLDASVDVVHKHRIGSCKGRLIATPQGLRYETDDKDDRFTVALSDLEIFEVDYLAKVLRVKAVKGRRFEFSDPAAANGDRLYVFHRDVDKARQRLKQGS